MASQDLSNCEPVRDADGKVILHVADYPFSCVEIILTDKAGHLLPAGWRKCWSFRFEIKGYGVAKDLNPLLVQKVEIGYYPVLEGPEPQSITLKEFTTLSPALVLDYRLAEPVLLPVEASIDKDGRLCWALTKVEPVVRVWSWIPVQKEEENET